jgi:hypothetical protein
MERRRLLDGYTGASPKEHGIIANQWLLATGNEVSSVSDEETSLVTSEGGADQRKSGASPRRLLLPTVGDALIEQLGDAARVVSVSVKDRGAILPAGKRGQAYWLGATGVVTSSYYKESLPSWVLQYERSHPLLQYLRDGWPLYRPEQEYQSPPDAHGYSAEEWSPEFPHQVVPGADLSAAVASSPFGDEVVIDVALAALEGEALGQDEIPDLLAISLSSTDKIGHQFGPESRELEDQMFRLDAQIARLVKRLRESMDPSQFLLVLSADHGACESAEFLQKNGQPGRRLSKNVIAEVARATLKRRYGHEGYFLGVTTPFVFLNRDAIARDQVSLEGVRQLVATALRAVAGVHVAHVLGDRAPEGPLGRRLIEAIHPRLSGDIYLVPEQYTHFLQADSMGATHGSPWAYDTHVPAILVGPGVRPGTSRGPFDVRSLAPTVAFLAGILPPAAARAPRLPLDR